MSESILAAAALLSGCFFLRDGLGTEGRVAKTVVWLITLAAGANYIWWRSADTVDYTADPALVGGAPAGVLIDLNLGTAKTNVPTLNTDPIRAHRATTRETRADIRMISSS